MVAMDDGLPKTRRIRTWVKAAKRHGLDKPLLARTMSGLQWKRIPCTMSVIGRLTVRHLVREGRIAGITHLAESRDLEPLWLVGIRTTYPDGVAQIYALVLDGTVMPMANDFWPHVLHGCGEAGPAPKPAGPAVGSRDEPSATNHHSM